MTRKYHLFDSYNLVTDTSYLVLARDSQMQDELTLGIRTLNKLAKILKARRIANGALTLASPEVRFQLENDSQDPIDVGILYDVGRGV
jgi:exoribonuclease R